jgi:hypothetical protein
MDDPLAKFERRFDLDANEVLGIFEARPPRFIAHGQPIRTDQHRVTGAHLLLEHPHKVLPRLDSALDIHEQAF